MTRSMRFVDYFDEPFKPRLLQVQALNWLQENWEKNRTLAMQLSCGAGKSAIAMAIARYNTAHGLTTSYVTPQRLLQAQLKRDYPNINMLQGAANYPCLRYADDEMFNVEKAKLADLCKKCSRIDECQYYVNRAACYTEDTTIYNPLSYLYLNKFQKVGDVLQPLYTADTIILDEVQSVPSMLSGLFDIKIWRFEHRYTKGISASIPSVVETLTLYAASVSTLLESRELPVEKRIALQQILSKVNYTKRGLQDDPSNFVVEEFEEMYRKQKCDCLKIRVACPPKWILKWFFGETPHIILMSGTLSKLTITELGLDNDYALLDLPSPIDKDRRAFLPIPLVQNSYGNKDNAMLEMRDAILDIAAIHPNERGIVLCTYEQAKSLSGLLDGNPRFIFHDKDTKGKTIEKFMQGEGEDLIAVLSGAWEGLDLKGELARFVIITKCLFANVKDGIVLRRMDLFPLSYETDTIETIIQGANRATRNETDWSIVYMIDSNFRRLCAKVKHLLPKYFLESIKWNVNINNYKEVAHALANRLRGGHAEPVETGCTGTTPIRPSKGPRLRGADEKRPGNKRPPIRN